MVLKECSVKRVVIVGLGSIGRRHLRLLKQRHPEIDVVLVRSGKGLSWPEESLASFTVSSIDEALLMKVDAGIVSSPAPFHIAQATELIKAGVPVLIEKPLSNALDGVNAFKTLAQDLHAIVLVGYILRYSESAILFHKIAMDGWVGEPISANIECKSYLPDWRPEQNYRTTGSAIADLGGGVLLELSHEIDYANWFFGPFKNIWSTLKNSGTLDIDVEDIADLVLFGPENFRVSMHLDFCSEVASRFCNLVGSKGSVTWDGLRDTVTWNPLHGKDEQWSFGGNRDAIFTSQLNHFFKCIEENDTSTSSLNEAIATLTLVETAKQSHAQGVVVHL